MQVRKHSRLMSQAQRVRFCCTAKFVDAINQANAAVNQTGYIPTLPSGIPNTTMPAQAPPTQMGGGSASDIKLLDPADGSGAGGGDAGKPHALCATAFWAPAGP